MANTYDICACGAKKRTIGKECRKCWMEKLSDRMKNEYNLRRGVPRDEKTRKKISVAQKEAYKKSPWGFKKDYIPWNKGTKGLTKWKPERREKIMKFLTKNGSAMKGKHHTEESRRLTSLHGIWGDKNVNWKGGVAHLNKRGARQCLEWRLWWDNCVRRDNYTCRVCLTPNSKIVVHHIKRWSDYKELRHTVSNGITLCQGCHGYTLRKEVGMENFFNRVLVQKPVNRLRQLQDLSNKIQAEKNRVKRGNS